jgi:hypothetical protein
MTAPPPALPWPAAWPSRASRWMLLNLIFIGMIAVGLGGISVAALYAGDQGPGLLFGGGAVMCVLVVAGVAPLHRIRRRWRPRVVTIHTTGSGERGVRIPYSAWWFGWLVTLIAITGGLFAAVVLWVLLASGLEEARNVIGVMLGLAAVPYCGWFLLDVVRGRVARGGVVLTPNGIHHRYLMLDEFLAWDSVMSVAARHERGPTIEVSEAPGKVRRRITSWVALRRLPPSGPVKLYGRLLAVDPAVAYHAVGYYRSRPDVRRELATDAGLRRIRTGNLLTGSARVP